MSGNMLDFLFADRADGWRWRRFKRQARVVGQVTAILTAAVVSSAWATMITVGNIHGWWSHIPTMSFGQAVMVIAPGFFVAAIWQVIVEALKS